MGLLLTNSIFDEVSYILKISLNKNVQTAREFYKLNMDIAIVCVKHFRCPSDLSEKILVQSLALSDMSNTFSSPD